MADVGSDFVFEFLFLLRLICLTCVGVSNILVEVLRFARSSFCRTMLCISAVYAIMQCLSSLNLLFPSLTLIIPHLFFCPYTALCRHAVSVCLSVTFMYSVNTNNHFFRNFYTHLSHHSFFIQNVMVIF